MKRLSHVGLGLLAALALCTACNNQGGNKEGNTEQAQAAAVVKFVDSDILPIGDSYATSADAAKVTILEFSDFECPFCSRAAGTIDEIKAKYGKDVKVVFKNNPLPFHKNATLAAQAAIAAGKQGKFFEMHDLLFKNQRALQEADLKNYATQIGLDMAKFEADLKSDAVAKMVQDELKFGGSIGVNGTPNFKINGVEVSGAQPLENFVKVIDAEIAAVDEAIKGGAKLENIYAERVKKNFVKKAPPAPKVPQDAIVYKLPLTESTAIKGAKEPLVVIHEFSDFQCPFCNRVNPTIAQIMEKYGDKVQIRFMQNPLPFHKDAPLAAKASLAAGDQGKFFEMHDQLFANQKDLSREAIEGYAANIGLDMDKFKADLDSDKYQQIINNDQKLAAQFGANGTPNFFINGRNIVGAQPFENFQKLIDEEIAKAEKAIADGTPRAEVYNKLTEKGAEKVAAPERPARPAEDTTTVHDVKFDVTKDGVRGDDKALVTIVEFSDFQCPFCSRGKKTIDDIVAEYGDKVRVVFKHNPLPFHKDAGLAAAAALAAKEQGKFWQMHDIMFDNQRDLSAESIKKYAAEIGLDMAKFEADLEKADFKTQIDGDQAEAKRLGASGTPSFFINGRNLRGAQPIDNFKKIIDEEIAKKAGK